MGGRPTSDGTAGSAITTVATQRSSAGWRMLEFTWQDVTDRPWLVVSSLADALALRPLRWTAAK